ncbi:hypothetical protein ASPFODRAFT_57600 [Aspergillus luchuensis CBS 106.47]|uniref:Uncharacterized protein n=1 Tax=Aspergillus luchuensis (strain CBS 106.47) TaxID=1137211 RepID=A0A1M3TX76_ASPLC|nr:hypothetical protein ASPFODRAFT_57600 [Aspergillus luchuensis CBS 106.47]
MMCQAGTRYRTLQPASAACRGTVIGHPQSPKWTPKGAALRSSVPEKLESQLLPDKLRPHSYTLVLSLSSPNYLGVLSVPPGHTNTARLTLPPVMPLSGPVASPST